MSAVMQLARWFVYAVRLVLYLVYGLLAFVAKPASPAIVAALAAPVAYVYRLPLLRLVVLTDWHAVTPGVLLLAGLALMVCMAVTFAPLLALLRPVVRLVVIAALALAVLQYTHWRGFDIASRLDTKTAVIDAIVALEFVLAASVYGALSRVLTLVLGAFPPMVRPLRPLRRLKATGQAVKPVRVSLAVPPL
jgi:hypothetical protein